MAVEGFAIAQRSQSALYELEWTFDVRFLGDEPYHSLTPLQPSRRSPFPWEEAPENLNEFLNRLAAEDGTNA
jgi:hypothetical protein